MLRSNSIADRIVDDLTSGPATRDEIIQALGANPGSIGTALHRLQGRDGCTRRIRVGAWRENPQNRYLWERVYTLGTSRDAKRPPSLTGTEKSQRFRAKPRAPRPPASVFDLARVLT